jgi:putative heme-binding domain-containing protein
MNLHPRFRARAWALFALVCSAAVAAPIDHGRAIYRSNCAFCHGLTGTGGRGPNLVSGQLKPDAELKTIVKNGIPGSTMPAFANFDPSELNSLVLFMKHLAGTNRTPEKVNGNPKLGRELYSKLGCSNCHQVGTEGSTYGPELTRIGNARPVHYLRESITEPGADIPEQFEGVTVVTKDGKRFTGIRANEDTFSVQIRMPDQTYRSFIKADVKEVVHEKRSLMPAYKNLKPGELENLVAYMASLRAAAQQGAKTKQAEGIR